MDTRPCQQPQGQAQQPAGMTEGEWAPADRHWYHGYGMDIRFLEHDE